MLPLTAGFLISGPLAGIWSDRLGPRRFTIGGQLAGTIVFVLLGVLPVDFSYWAFALLLLAFGLAMGAFSSSNAAEVMGAVDPAQRGSAAGIRATGLNCGQTLAISLFFTLLTAGLAARLPQALISGLGAAGVPAPQAAAVAHLPPVAMLFATFLGYNPIQSLLGPALHSMPAVTARTVTSSAFFPHIISGPFHDGLRLTFGVAAALMLLATVACVLTRPRRAGTLGPTAGGPERAAARADQADVLAAEAARLEAQVRRWRQLVMADGAAVPLIITVSAPLGAGGDQVAQRLAGQLDLTFVDRAIPAAVAEQLSVPVTAAQAHDEQREHGALRLLVSAANTEPLFGLEIPGIDSTTRTSSGWRPRPRCGNVPRPPAGSSWDAPARSSWPDTRARSMCVSWHRGLPGAAGCRSTADLTSPRRRASLTGPTAPGRPTRTTCTVPT